MGVVPSCRKKTKNANPLIRTVTVLLQQVTRACSAKPLFRAAIQVPCAEHVYATRSSNPLTSIPRTQVQANGEGELIQEAEAPLAGGL